MTYNLVIFKVTRGLMALLEEEERQICVLVTNINYNAAFLI